VYTAVRKSCDIVIGGSHHVLGEEDELIDEAGVVIQTTREGKIE
jgi:hypothetical protein